MVQSKFWVVTLNNYTDGEYLSLLEYCRAKCSYFVIGKEVGESGTPHLQCYLECTQRTRRATISRAIPRAYIDQRHGTAQEASTYCQKDGNFLEEGEIAQPSPGHRTDFDLLKDAIKAGDSVHDLYENHTSLMVRYNSGCMKLIKQLRPRKKLKGFPLESFAFHPIVLEDGFSHVIVGSSGCGKTSYCRSLFPTALFVSHMDDLAAFDSEFNEAIIFDDMSFVHMPRTAQIHVVDQDDDRSIHIRYTTAFIPAGTIKVFTTNVREIFLDDPAINRRVKFHVIHSL